MQKILVIEDEPYMRRNLIAALQKGNFGVIGAENGEQGLALARTEAPDLVLCDVTMPGMDGHAVLRKLRENARTSNIPFIFLTGRGDHSDFRSGMNLGADDYLAKPVSTEELLAAITARLHRHHTPSARSKTTRRDVESEANFAPTELLQPLGLTAREAEVLHWVSHGKTNPEIGIILGIRPRTVKKHLEHVFAKLGVETRTAATRIALEASPQRDG